MHDAGKQIAQIGMLTECLQPRRQHTADAAARGERLGAHDIVGFIADECGLAPSTTHCGGLKMTSPAAPIDCVDALPSS